MQSSICKKCGTEVFYEYPCDETCCYCHPEEKCQAMISLREHISGLFVVGWYYYLIDNSDLGAKTCWDTAEVILFHNILQGTYVVGSA